MVEGDTIVACASPAGVGVRAVVRVSGPQTGAALAAVLRGPDALGWRRGASRAVMVVRDCGAELSLAVVVLRFVGPGSYTGEDAAELVVPGNPHLVLLVLAALLAQPGVRMAGPGEFSGRAYLAGKLSLDQAEGVAAMIAAQTNEQLVAARGLMDGTTGARYAAWSDELTTLAALVEAGIDFTDQEDVVAIAPAALAARLGTLRDQIRTLAGAARGTRVDQPHLVAALVGEPNAGKSTLFNALLGRIRAVASPRAGTTRDVLEEVLEVGSAGAATRVLVQDLAGLSSSLAARGGASDRAAILAAQAAAARADVLVWCDPSGVFDEARLAELLGAPIAGRRVLRVRTFGDRGGTTTHADALAVCALDGWHVAALARALGEYALAAGTRGSALAALAPRHHAALARALAGIAGALGVLDVGGARASLAEPEVLAAHLRESLLALGELTGRSIAPDDVLGRIFATFCVGK